MRMQLILAAAAGLACLALAPSSAQDEGGEAAPAAVGEPARYEFERSARIGAGTVRYRAIASEMHIENDDDEPVVSIFSIAYLADGYDDPTERPVIFVFNGGPGSASLWLHMGVFGPRRVAVPSEAEDDGAPPYDIVDNPYSMLDVADLVFIDPPGTGYSRAIGEGENSEFWGVREDARIVGRFIRRWLTENGRWNSPKYLAGESYGTTRAAALVDELTGGWTDVAFNGVMLISTIIDFQQARFAPANDAPHIAYLPTMAATGWYHGRVDQSAWDGDLEAFLEEVRDFAVRQYAPALILGESISDEERAEVAAALSRYTGLSEDYVLRARLRIQAWRFMRELLRDEGLVVGRLDSRYTGVEEDDTGEASSADPSAYGIDAAYTAAVNDYLGRELGVDITRDYNVLSGRVSVGWSWSMEDGPNWPAYVDLTPGLAAGMRQNSDMRILLLSGYYDMATPFFGAETSLRRAGMPQDRIVRHYYEAGHMMYVHEPSLEQMAADMHAFVVGE